MKFAFRFLALLMLALGSIAHAAPERDDAPPARHEQKLAEPGEEMMGDLMLQAMSLMGIAYRFGGNNPNQGFDCSGFIRYIFQKSVGISLPRTASEQARAGRPVSRTDIQPGDVLFFNTRGFDYSHNALYLGNGKFIHAPRTGKNIEIANLSSSYWSSRFNGARRMSRGGNISSAEVLDDLNAAKKRKDKGSDAIAAFADGGDAPRVKAVIRNKPEPKAQAKDDTPECKPAKHKTRRGKKAAGCEPVKDEAKKGGKSAKAQARDKDSAKSRKDEAKSRSGKSKKDEGKSPKYRKAADKADSRPGKKSAGKSSSKKKSQS